MRNIPLDSARLGRRVGSEGRGRRLLPGFAPGSNRRWLRSGRRCGAGIPGHLHNVFGGTGVDALGKEDYGAVGIMLCEAGKVGAIGAARRTPGVHAHQLEGRLLRARVLPATVHIQPCASRGLVRKRVQIATAHGRASPARPGWGF